MISQFSIISIILPSSWMRLYIKELMSKDFMIKLTSFNVFKTIYKFWEYERYSVTNNSCIDENNMLYGEK